MPRLLPCNNRDVATGRPLFSRVTSAQADTSRAVFVGNFGQGRGDTVADITALAPEADAVLLGSGHFSFLLFDSAAAAGRFLATVAWNERPINVAKCLYCPDTEKFQRAKSMPRSTHLPPEALAFAGEPPPPGLSYREAFLSAEEAAAVIAFVDSQPWIEGTLKRRVQHYGRHFDYSSLLPTSNLGELPPALADLASNVLATGLITMPPNQATVNEYMPGNGIGFHIDTHSPFKEAIVVVSLASDIPMHWKRRPRGAYLDIHANKAEFDRRFDCLLEANSLAVFAGEAREAWEHGIISRKVDVIHGEVVPRKRRLSVTFRHVSDDGCCACDWADRCDVKNPHYLTQKCPERVR